MYTLAVERAFIAQHYLIGGDWGPENELHSHHYRVEIQVEGETLDEHGYLVDLVQVDQLLEAILDRYRDRTLNDLPEFEGLNPSIEHFSRLICSSLSSQITAPNIRAVMVKVWENDVSWASYRSNREGF